MIVNREMTAMAASSRKLLRMSALLAGLCVAGAFARFTLSASPTGDVTVYTDALGAGWQNWSWSSTVDLASTNPVHTGTDAIAVTFTAAWAGVYLHVSPALDGTQFESLVFWIHGGTAGGQQMRVVLYDGSGNAATPVTVTPPGAGQWTQVNVSIASLGAPAQISGIVWQDTTGGALARRHHARRLGCAAHTDSYAESYRRACSLGERDSRSTRDQPRRLRHELRRRLVRR